MLEKLRALPTACRILPYVMASYGENSEYVWNDECGQSHFIPQGEGGEQGDALMPALFCLGLHDSLLRAQTRLGHEDVILAYLDDIYIVTSPHRARLAYDVVVNEIENGTGIRPNLGKTECWAANVSEAPTGIPELDAPYPSPPVWKGNLPLAERGLMILGSPIGTEDFVKKVLAEKLAEESEFLERIVEISDVQLSWLLMYFCGSPRASYLLRTIPNRLDLLPMFYYVGFGLNTYLYFLFIIVEKECCFGVFFNLISLTRS